MPGAEWHTQGTRGTKKEEGKITQRLDHVIVYSMPRKKERILIDILYFIFLNIFYYILKIFKKNTRHNARKRIRNPQKTRHKKHTQINASWLLFFPQKICYFA